MRSARRKTKLPKEMPIIAPVERLLWVLGSEGWGDGEVVIAVVAGKGGASEVVVGLEVLDMDVGVEVLAVVDVEDVVEVVGKVRTRLLNVTGTGTADGTFKGV